MRVILKNFPAEERPAEAAAVAAAAAAPAEYKSQLTADVDEDVDRDGDRDRDGGERQQTEKRKDAAAVLGILIGEAEHQHL